MFFYIIFSPIFKNIIKKKTKKSFQKGLWEVPKPEEEKDQNCQYACEQYRNLSEEEKEEKHHYGCEWYKQLLGLKNKG